MSAATNVADDLARLSELLCRKPPHSNWSYATTLDFKLEVCKAVQLLRKDRPKPASVAACLRALRRYYDEDQAPAPGHPF